MNGEIRYGKIRKIVTEACGKASKLDESGAFCTHDVEMEARAEVPGITTTQVSGAMSHMYSRKELVVLSMKSPCKYLKRAHDSYRLNTPTPANRIDFTPAPKLDVCDYNAVIRCIEAEIAKLETKKAGLESVIRTLKDLLA